MGHSEHSEEPAGKYFGDRKVRDAQQHTPNRSALACRVLTIAVLLVLALGLTAPATSADPGGESPAAEASEPVTSASRAVAIGDSVLLGAANALYAALPGLENVDARVARQAPEVLQIARRLRLSGQLPPVVILQTGTNGPLYAELLDQILTELDGASMVVVLTVYVPRPWQETTNQSVYDAVAYHPNARIADWYSLAAAAPWYVADDGYHMTAAGAAAVAAIIAATIDAG